MKSFSLLFSLTLLLFFPQALLAGLAWKTGFIDQPDRVRASSLKIAIDGTEYIAFGGHIINSPLADNLKLAKRSPGGQWQIETVDGDPGAKVGINPSLALDSNGYPKISYYEGTNGNLKYASWNGTSWSIEIVDAKDTTCEGRLPSLALDSYDKPRISYWGCDQWIKYAAFNGTSWDIEYIYNTNTMGEYNSLAIDSNDHPHISYYESVNDDLRYVYNNGSGWAHQDVDTAGIVGQYNSIALDSNDYPRISYYDASNSALKLATWNGSTWDIVELDSTGGLYTSLMIDSGDLNKISYWDSANSSLKVYAEDSGSINGFPITLITIKTVGSGGIFSSIALGSDNKLRVSHFFAQTGELKLSTRSTSWTTETVAQDGLTRLTNGAIAIDPDGNPGVAYYYQGTDQIKYASYNGTTWDIQTVASSAATRYQYPALVFKSTGEPVVAYTDSTNSDLKVAVWTGSSWYIDTAAATGLVGTLPSIILNSNGNPHISHVEYVDPDNRRLKYSHWNSNTLWSTETLTFSGQVSHTSSIDLTSTGKPVIAYCEINNGVVDTGYLRLSYYNGSSWEDRLIDSTGVVQGGDISLKVDSQDNIHISYYDYTNQKLKYAFAPFSVVSPWTAWDIQTLSGAVSGRENSLVLDNNDRPGISYSDYTNDKYLYTYYNGSSWVTSVVTTGVIGSYPQNAAAMDNNGKIWIAYREELKDDLKFAVSKSAFPWPMMFPAIQNRRP